MKSISVSENLHRWIMDHKNSERTSAEKVIYGLIGEVDCLRKKIVGNQEVICKESYPYSCVGDDELCSVCGYPGKDHIFRNGKSILKRIEERG